MVRRHDDGEVNHGIVEELSEAVAARLEGRTPPPASSKPATIGDLAVAVAAHREKCAGEQAEARRPMWGEITGGKLAMERIEARFRTLVLVATLAVGLAGALATIGVFVARYAVIGAITEQLDKRLGPVRVARERGPSPIIGSAEAAQVRP